MIWGSRKNRRNRRMRSSVHSVIETIRDFLDGTGGRWDWDDFISLPTGYPVGGCAAILFSCFE